MAEPYGHGPSTIGAGHGGAQGRPDLLRVALVAYAAHLNQRALVRIPRGMTAWGLAGRLAQVDRWPRSR